MAVISTSELFDKYFAEKSEDIVKKTRAQFDRPEVYVYEAKLGKQMVDMNADELFEMIMSFNNHNRNDNTEYVLPYSSFTHLASGYRAIFNYYIDNFEVIKNPFYDKKMRGSVVAERISEKREPFTVELLNKAIANLHATCEPDRANYIEAIMLLFYNGFALPEEIVELKESMIDFDNKEVHLERTTVKLSDRCFELLKWVHSREILECTKTNFFMASWRKGYFKYPIFASRAVDFNERDRTDISRSITSFIKKFVKPIDGQDINFRLIYMLGFFNKLVEDYGSETARKLVASVRNSDDADMLMRSAKEYGIIMQNVTWLKKSLRPFV